MSPRLSERRPPREESDSLVERGTHEHYDDPILYDYEYRRRRLDVNFYRRLARRVLGDSGDVLELACGTGRVTRALLRDGHRVLGMDLSAPMLERARARIGKLGRAARARAQLIRGDMQRFSLGRRFPLIVMAFNSFEHLYTRVEVAACLERIREHLEPDGVLAFDVQNPNLRWLCRDPERRWARTRFRHPESGDRLIYSTNHIYDPVSQIALIRIYYEADEASGGRRSPGIVYLSQRKFFPAELEGLMHANGFAVVERFGDFGEEPLDGESESQVLLCAVRP